MTTQNTQIIQNDEIDLIELIFSIWRKKWWVVLFTVIFAVGSVLYALTAKDQWTSKAEIIAPNIKEMGNFLETYERYYAIVNQTQTQTQTQTQFASGVLFSNFSSAIGSYEKQIEFFKQSPIFRLLTEKGLTESQALKTAADAVVVLKPTDKDKGEGVDYIIVSFAAEEDEIAQKTLGELVQFVNSIVRQTMIEDLQTEIATKIKTLGIKKESIKQFSDKALEVRLKNLQKALLIAKNAGIKEYSKERNGELLLPGNIGSEAGVQLTDSRLADSGFLFMLGEKYLQAQIEALTGAEVVYPGEYYEIELQIDLLSDLLAEKNQEAFNTFHYQSAPNLPLQRDKSKRALIVSIGTFLGGMIGVLVALFMAALDNRKARERQV